MVLFTHLKGAAPILELPPQVNTKKASATSAELPPIQSKIMLTFWGIWRAPLLAL